MGRHLLLDTWHTMRCTAASTCKNPSSKIIVYGMASNSSGRYHTQPPAYVSNIRKPQMSNSGPPIALSAFLRARMTMTLPGVRNLLGHKRELVQMPD